jgi:hypothetical protein
LPSRWAVKAIFRPSRDQAGSKSSPFAVVSRATIVPSGFIVKMSKADPSLSERLLPNAISEPSGDQAGSPSGCFVNVSCVTLAPFESITQMLGPPMRSLMKAIRCPFGDHVGSMSCLELFVSRVCPVPSAFMT